MIYEPSNSATRLIFFASSYLYVGNAVLISASVFHQLTTSSTFFLSPFSIAANDAFASAPLATLNITTSYQSCFGRSCSHTYITLLDVASKRADCDLPSYVRNTHLVGSIFLLFASFNTSHNGISSTTTSFLPLYNTIVNHSSDCVFNAPASSVETDR
jgi:hypothetical protein